MSELQALVTAVANPARAQALFQQLEIDRALITARNAKVTRAILAQALNMLLFENLLQRVPLAQHYVQRCLAQNRKIIFDHGALRTVLWPTGALPAGEAAITRVLKPLGYERADVYPLPKLNMTGRAYRHIDFPATIAQFFVSELHPEAFSKNFQATVTRVLANSRDPLQPPQFELLHALEFQGFLSLSQAVELLPALLRCFQRQHEDLSWDDYQTLLAESAEMAWIATEGNVFNHATDRVMNLADLVQQLQTEGYSLKKNIEVSANGRVRQTALVAAKVERSFYETGGQNERHEVPGSFFEFIQRDFLPDAANKLDLSFDTGNATGIFQVTR